MPRYTLEFAKQNLDSWLAASLALSTSQSYSIGTRTLTRANSAEVMRWIEYWQKEVDNCTRAAAGLKAPSRVRRYVPYDL